MKIFWAKLTGVVLAVLILFTYQNQAHTLARMTKEVETSEKKVEEILEQSSESEDQSVSGNHSGQVEYKDGTFTGSGTGFSGEMTAEVTVEGGKITSIEIVDTNDDSAYLDKARALIDDIIENQTTEGIDAVSGATYSSNGIIDAVKDALSGDE